MENKRTILPIVGQLLQIIYPDDTVRIENEYGAILDSDECRNIFPEYFDKEVIHMDHKYFYYILTIREEDED